MAEELREGWNEEGLECSGSFCSVHTEVVSMGSLAPQSDFYCCDKHNDQKHPRRTQSITQEVSAGTQGRNLEAGTKAEAMEGCCLLTHLHGSVSLLSYITQDHPSRVGTVCSGLSRPTASPTGQSDGDIFSTEVLSSHTTPVVSN